MIYNNKEPQKNYKMEKLKKTAILNGVGIIGILGGTTSLVLLNILNEGAFILAAIACYPMVKYLWQFAGYIHRDTILILRKALPKAGFSIENTEWNDQHTTIRFHGKYQGDNFMVEAANESVYIMIYDMPWQGVKSSDPIVPKIMEAINEVNSAASNMSVVMCEPNEDGMRHIYTLSRTILPTFRPEQYIDSLMCDMLNRKPALVEAVNKERPYMVQRRGPVGFNVQQTSANTEEQISPAAKTKSEVKD